jgi:hypothetical protein
MITRVGPVRVIKILRATFKILSQKLARLG